MSFSLFAGLGWWKWNLPTILDLGEQTSSITRRKLASSFKWPRHVLEYDLVFKDLKCEGLWGSSATDMDHLITHDDHHTFSSQHALEPSMNGEEPQHKRSKPSSVPSSVLSALHRKVSAVQRNIQEVLLPTKEAKIATISLLRQRILQKYHAPRMDRDVAKISGLVPLYSSEERHKYFPSETIASIPLQVLSTHHTAMSSSTSPLFRSSCTKLEVMDSRLWILPKANAVLVTVTLHNSNE